MEILIKNYEENELFTDLQIKGPFNYWEHNHIFKYENNKTIMYDVINYNSKFKIFDKMYIFHLIFKIVFYYREKKILAIFLNKLLNVYNSNNYYKRKYKNMEKL